MFMLLSVVGSTMAQTSTHTAMSLRDSVLLSEKTDGGYNVRTYRVASDADADYQVRYRINMATLNTSFEKNAEQLDNLGDMLAKLQGDPHVHIERAVITGYASPDGSEAFNKSLAHRRAEDFKSYIDKRYSLLSHIGTMVDAVAEDWEACRRAVSESQIPDRDAVLQIIGSNRSQQGKEAAIKGMPAAWNYIKTNILPPMRRVEMVVDYVVDRIVEERVAFPVETVEVAPEPKKECPCECIVVDESISGMIVEIPEKEVWREIRAERSLNREIDRAARRAARQELRALHRAERELRRAER